MPSKIKIKILVVSVLLLVAGVLLAQGRAVSVKDLLSTSSYVVSGVWLILFLWDKWFWAFPILHLLSKRPDLRGTWKGTLQSDYP
jgi:SMODS-associating 2TM, beta-strand rich effector domain